MPRPILLFALLAIAVGCDDSRNPGSSTSQLSQREIDQFQSQFLLDEDPAGSQTVIEVRDALKASEKPGDPVEVVIMGKIGGMPNPYGDDVEPDFPWRQEKAVLFLVDPATADKFKNHVHEKGQECSICLSNARHSVDTVAIVQFRDKSNEPIPSRVDEILALEEGETVVITGMATMVVDTLVVQAEGIYVVDEAPAIASDAGEGEELTPAP